MAKKMAQQEYSVATKGADIKEGTRGSRFATVSVSIFFIFSIIFSISLVSFSIVFFLSVVQGPSMMATLNAAYTREDPISDSVIVNRYATARVGDIIVIKYYWNKDNINEKAEWGKATMEDEKGRYEYFIKRLVALEGDTIYLEPRDANNQPIAVVDIVNNESAHHYALIINGIEADEFYQKDNPDWRVMKYYGFNFFKLLLNPASIDVTYPYFKSNVKFIPERARNELVVPDGFIFFMGDNRGSANEAKFSLYHSYDCTAFGPQPAENIVGVVADIINHTEDTPEYVWRKIKEFFSFGWI